MLNLSSVLTRVTRTRRGGTPPSAPASEAEAGEPLEPRIYSYPANIVKGLKQRHFPTTPQYPNNAFLALFHF